MSLLDDVLVDQSDEVFDAIVIGSGITGGYAAKELTERGLKTLMLERGPLVEHGKDYRYDNVPPWEQPQRGKVAKAVADGDYAIQSQSYAFNETTRAFFGNDRELPYSTEPGKEFHWIRSNQLGGRSLIWARQCYRWSDYEFSANAADGHGVDWPLRYRDLAPWYAKVERFVGISGAADGLAQLPDSICQPAFGMMAPERAFGDMVARSDTPWDVIIARVANLTQPTQAQTASGRVRCQARDACASGCGLGAYFSTQSATLPAALATGKLRIAANSVVHSLIYDASRKRVRGVRVIDRLSLRTREYFGKMVFLCASTLGSTQILLNSTSRTMPDGLANRSHTLGHYLMDHRYAAYANARVPGFEDNYYSGRRPTGLLMPNIHYEPKRYAETFDRGYCLAGNAYREDWRSQMKSAGFGPSFKARLSRPGDWRFQLFSQGEMLPRYDNSVSLHPTLKDAWGIAQLHIDCEWSQNEQAMGEAAGETCRTLFEAAGYDDIKVYVGGKPPGNGNHEMGTARMGRDPKTSVFNGHNQAHDIGNLFCTDGATMCSSGSQNPSLTFMAMTVRAVDFAVNERRNKRL
ncbi:MAG: GMC family oxidoreductase [Pseudomonadota bacterium]